MKVSSALLAILVCTASPSLADVAAGRGEYLAVCAGCHGVEGRGDGPLAEVLTIETPALTGLAAANGGEFPFLEVFLTIDGRGGVRAHGSDMPVWGNRFSSEMMIFEYPETAQLIARGRVLSLVDYLVSIQE
jgi:mono/diheme cytochrome c family protein